MTFLSGVSATRNVDVRDHAVILEGLLE